MRLSGLTSLRPQQQGTDFGTVEANAIDSVTYGLKGHEYVACSSGGVCGCEVTKAHEEIECDMVEGAGAALRFVVTIDGQTSTAPTIAYGRPEIRNVTCADGECSSPTSGGQRVNISGSNFGPATPRGASNVSGDGLYLDSVTFGPVSGTEFSASDCTVESHEEIVCRTAHGVGGLLNATSPAASTK